MAIVLLVRHGSTDLNEQGVIRGWNDPPLSEKGQEQAKEAAEDVMEELPKIKRLYSSDLTRAKETAFCITVESGIKAVETKSLRPWNAGVLAGRQVPNIGEVLEYYATNRDEAPEDGESMRTFIHRLLNFMSEVLDDAELGVTPIVCVTSIRPIEVLMGWIDTGMRGDRIGIDRLAAKEDSVRPGGLLKLQHSKKGGWVYEFIDGDEKEEDEKNERLANERPRRQVFGYYGGVSPSNPRVR